MHGYSTDRYRVLDLEQRARSLPHPHFTEVESKSFRLVRFKINRRSQGISGHQLGGLSTAQYQVPGTF